MNQFRTESAVKQTYLSRKTHELIRQARQESLTFQRLRDGRWRNRIDVGRVDTAFAEPDEPPVDESLFR